MKKIMKRDYSKKGSFLWVMSILIVVMLVFMVVAPVGALASDGEVAQEVAGLDLQALPDVDVPLASGVGYWALSNLILMLFNGLLMVILFAGYAFSYKKDTKNVGVEAEVDDTGGYDSHSVLFRMLSIIPYLIAFLVFAYTQHTGLPMRITDQWTLLMVLLAMVQIGVFIKVTRKQSETSEVKEVA